MKEESKIEALEERIKELEEKIEEPDSSSENEMNNERSAEISRRDFLKKAGLGLGGLTALASPVSADYFIKDDSFSVQTSSDGGSTLSEGLFVDSNQNVSVPNGFLSIPDANGVSHRFESASDGSSGLTLRTTTNQDEIFQVRSSGQAVRFAVYHNNKTYVGDDLEVNNQIFENGNNRVATRNWSNNNLVSLEGDSLTGNLNLGSNDIQQVGSINPGGQTLTLGGNLDLNSNNISNLAQLNGADMQNAASGTVPTSQGDGTFKMQEMSGNIYVETDSSIDPTSQDGDIVFYI